MLDRFSFSEFVAVHGSKQLSESPEIGKGRPTSGTRVP